ncbi:DUF4123 domain-containing protein [Rubrivivax rivuli]|uniref:DUF4123 domain-containing protein n=1 Tax=Rubrivivax rivuli TaxID=1862385 RepID=A0A437RDY8_9BURK|nr:DUF4123 domain-containing protein [Rubrivivax rivuli]RVU44975.1 DUF4123 domain-containing protein [Rubrivivax rivuli]
MTVVGASERQQALWPAPAASRAGSVWAVLDCAREPAVYGALIESRLEFRSLYSGSVPRALEMNAPQLVELLPGHRLAERLLGTAWGRAWGIFLRIDDAANLRHHLRKFLKVRDEQGRRLLFRYYDPRVLRSYLPTCTPEELAQVFGPIHSFVMEDAEGACLEFTLAAGQLRRRVLVAAAAPADLSSAAG